MKKMIIMDMSNIQITLKVCVDSLYELMGLHDFHFVEVVVFYCSVFLFNIFKRIM